MSGVLRSATVPSASAIGARAGIARGMPTSSSADGGVLAARGRQRASARDAARSRSWKPVVAIANFIVSTTNF